MLIEKTLTNKKSSEAEYDWFRSDMKDSVSQSPNFRDNYFISKNEGKTGLTLFSYNVSTHEQLTTYEPMRMMDSYNAEPIDDREFHTLTYLKSHRIRIDRNAHNSYANVTCIADFLVDQSSLEVYTNLVEDMKDLALFRVDLEEPNKGGDLHEFKQRAEHKKYLQGTRSIEQQIKYQRRVIMRNHKEHRKPKYFNLRTKRATHTTFKNIQNKPIMNIRLSFGPISVAQPIHDRVISCSLNLVNAQKMIMDYDNTVYKFLTSRDLGMDKNAEDVLEEKSKSIDSGDVNDFKMDVAKVEEMSDLELNDVFEKQEVVEKLEQEIIKEKGPEMFEAIITDILKKTEVAEEPKKVVHSVVENIQEKAHRRRFFDANNMFVMDKPFELDIKSYVDSASNSRYSFNYAFLILAATLAVYFY